MKMKPQPADADDQRRAFSISEAHALRVSECGIYRLIADGRLKAVKTLDRRVIPRASINKLLSGA